MTTLHQKTDEILAGLKASPREWPAYMVLRETLSPDLRVIVAVLIAEQLGERKDFINALLDIYESGNNRNLDDLYELPPPSGMENSRRLLRQWLSEGGKEQSYFRNLAPSAGQDGAEEDGNIKTLLEIGRLRFSSYEQVKIWHTNGRQFKNKILAGLTEKLIELGNVLQYDQPKNVAKLCNEDWSPFLQILWLKYCGEQAILNECPNLAQAFYTLAKSSSNEQFSGSSTLARFLELQIEISLISAESLLHGPQRALAAISQLREAYKGSPYVDIIEYLRFHFHWASDLEEEDPKYLPSTYPIEVRVNETAADLFALPEKIIACSANDESGASGAEFWLSAERSVAAGGYPLLYTLREAWAWALLTDKTPDIKEAMRQIVRSARSTAVQKFERWIHSASDTHLEDLEPEFFDELASLKDRLPSQLRQRESAYVHLLGVVASCDRMPAHISVTLFDRLAHYALNGHTGRWSNVSTKKPGLDGIFQLIENHIKPLLESRGEIIVNLVKQTLLGEYNWPMYEKALRIALKCASLMENEALLTLSVSILDCLETRMNPSNGDWMLLRPAFTFLGHDKVATLLLADQSVLLARAQSQANRYCLSGRMTEDMRGWEQAFLMVKKLNMGSSEEVQRAIEMHIMHAARSNSSDAAVNINRLLAYPDLLNNSQIIRSIEALIDIINWRSGGSGGMSPAIGSAAIAVFSVAYQWDKISAAYIGTRDPLYSKVSLLFDGCLQLLQEVGQRPSEFAELSFPRRTNPEPSTVYNWVYAVLSLATILGREEEARALLANISSNTQLQSSLNQAIGDFENFGLKKQGTADRISVGEIANANRNEFYSKLGSVLVRIACQPNNIDLIKETLNRCLAEGPRIEDLGVLSMALSVQSLRFSLPRNGIVEMYRDKLLRLDKSIDRNSMLMMNNILETLLVPVP